MLRNYFIIAWRHLLRNKAFSLINITGLSVGIASALLILFHVQEESGYDQGFLKADRIFRVTQEGLGEDTRHWAATSAPMGKALSETFPEIENYTTFHRPYPNQVLTYTTGSGEVKKFAEQGGFFADSTAPIIFDMQFSQGNARTALTEINSIIVTEQLAEKYFGTENPMGKTIYDARSKLPLKVTGVVSQYPFSTHLGFDYLLSMETINHYLDKASLARRTWNGFYTYVVLKTPGHRKQTEAKLPAFVATYFGDEGSKEKNVTATRKLHLQSITDIHLHSHLEKEMYANSDVTYVYIFSIVAIVILLLAAVNFVNLATAQSFSRMKEVGLRKVIGGTRKGLIQQFLGESILLVLLSTVIAIILLKGAIPYYNELTGKQLKFEQMFTWSHLSLLFLLIGTVGVLAGLYPALFVSGFNPIAALKGNKVVNSGAPVLRRGLIVFQFVISVFMIFSTVVIYRQMRFFHEKDLGFNKEQVVAINMYEEMWKNFGVLINKVRSNDALADYSITSTLPGDRFSMQPFIPLGTANDEDLPGSRILWSDENLISTLGLTLKEGRNFVSQFPEIRHPEFIVNEAAIKALKISDPFNKPFVLEPDTGRIVGIVKDFNFASLHTGIEPMVIQYNPYNANYLLVKVKPQRITEALKYLESEIKTLYPESVFTYTFVDEKLNLLYASENRMSSVFKIFSALALVISGLGLFGISAYSARVRIKEVGIRKLLGASAANLVVLLSGNFLKLVCAGILVAWPLGWWLMNRWLQSFAFHIDIDSSVFVISGITAMGLAIVTVSAHALKTALMNPIKNLRTE